METRGDGFVFECMGPFKCYVTLFSGNLISTNPLVALITLNLVPL